MEVNHVFWVFCNPNFRYPSDQRKEQLHWLYWHKLRQRRSCVLCNWIPSLCTRAGPKPPISLKTNELHVLSCHIPDLDCRIPDSDCRIPDSDCHVPVSDCHVPISDCRIPISDCLIPISDYLIPALRRLDAVASVSKTNPAHNGVGSGTGTNWPLLPETKVPPVPIWFPPLSE